MILLADHRLSSRMVLAVAALLCTLAGCNEDPLTGLHELVRGPRMTASMDIEMTTTVEPRGETTAEIDRLVARPIAIKQHVEIELGRDDRLRIETVKMESSLPPISIFKGLPDSQPEVVRTVWEDDRIKSYGADGHLLYDEPEPLPDATSLVRAVEQMQLTGRYGVGELIKGIAQGGESSLAEWEKYIDRPDTATLIERDLPGLRTATVPNVPGTEGYPMDAAILYDNRTSPYTVLGVQLYEAGTSNRVTSILYAYGESVDGYRPIELVQGVIVMPHPTFESVFGDFGCVCGRQIIVWDFLRILVRCSHRPSDPSSSQTKFARPRQQFSLQTRSKPVDIVTVSRFSNTEIELF